MKSGPKRDLLQLIKSKGDLSLEQAVDTLGLSKTNLRQHLAALEDQELISRKYESLGQGRPIVLFRLTEEGDRLFPNREAQMLQELLLYLKKENEEEIIDGFLKSFWKRREEEFEEKFNARAKGSKKKELHLRLETLRDLLEEQGFMPEISKAKAKAEIRECNCPFAGVVEVTKKPCKLEADFIRRALNSDIERTGYIPSGSNSCSYAVKIK